MHVDLVKQVEELLERHQVNADVPNSSLAGYVVSEVLARVEQEMHARAGLAADVYQEIVETQGGLTKAVWVQAEQQAYELMAAWIARQREGT